MQSSGGLDASSGLKDASRQGSHLQHFQARSSLQGLKAIHNTTLMWNPAGGTSLFTAVRDRLERELVEAAPQTAKVKVTAPTNSLERRFSVWIGEAASQQS